MSIERRFIWHTKCASDNSTSLARSMLSQLTIYCRYREGHREHIIKDLPAANPLPKLLELAGQKIPAHQAIIEKDLVRGLIFKNQNLRAFLQDMS